MQNFSNRLLTAVTAAPDLATAYCFGGGGARTRARAIGAERGETA